MREDKSIINQKTECMECAIAHCKEQAHDSDMPLLLVSGDMSGIQPFLYQIVSSKAAKNLKGRSCYIELLGKAVVESLLRALSLKRDHVVCESGGTFVLLAPNSPDVVKALDGAVKFIEKCIFNAHGTALSISIASEPITVQEASGGTTTLAQRWQELFQKREAKKNAKYSSLILEADGYARFFKPSSVTCDKPDPITGEDIPDGGKNVPDIGRVTVVNKSIIDLGAKLRDGCKPELVEDYQGEDFVIEPAGLGVKFRLKKGDDARRVKTFEQMCANDNDDALERLGVLRMDVDNLGSKFQEYAHTQSLAAYSALSQELDDFFKHHVDDLCKKRDCYLLYGGGDDLFVVGEWRKVIELAAEIHTSFKKWAQDRNGEWSLSAGVAIVKAKYPIIQGAKESGEEEDKAKSHVCAGLTKNSISFLGMPLNWELEFVTLRNLKNRIVHLLNDNEALPKSFLSKVLMHASKATVENHKVTDVRVYWHLSYDIKRAIERTKGKKDVITLLEQYRSDICTPGNTLAGESIATNYHLLELWALACRWAELEFRSINEKTKNNNYE